MVKLVDRLMDELKEAMRQKNTTKKAVISLLRSALLLAEKEKKSPLSEQEELALVRREMKQSQQVIAEAEKADRQDIVGLEKEKLEILTSYLPVQFTKDEIRSTLIQLGIATPMKLGDAMKLASMSLAGKADNRLLVETVKELLA